MHCRGCISSDAIFIIRSTRLELSECAFQSQKSNAHYIFIQIFGILQGTGKTKTVVAAIEKIVRTTQKNILVCAQSNAACDEIAQRLCKILTKKQMLRMYSMSYELDKLSSAIKPFCNLYDGQFKLPCLEDIYRYRVLICTLSTSGCLTRARHNFNFKPNHFGYVFIDECASAHETMALIPIAGRIFEELKLTKIIPFV